MDATWQSHADPRECLRGVSIFIFTRISMVTVHISIRYFEFKLTAIIHSPYIPESLSSSPQCGTMFPLFS